jgi:hypothetical protein
VERGLSTRIVHLKIIDGHNTYPSIPNWETTFHVHVYALAISLGAILVQPGARDLDHPISFARRKFSNSENNYNTTEREGLSMVYALQNFRHYLLGKNFKMFTDHSVIKYLVNKLVLGGRICIWILLFQEFDFEVIVKPRKFNVASLAQGQT